MAQNIAGALWTFGAIRRLGLLVMLGLHWANTGYAQFDSPPRSFTYGSVDQVAYTPDGRLLLTSGSDGIHVFDGATLEDVAHLVWSSTPLRQRTAGLTFGPDSRLVTAPYNDTTAVVWDLETFAVAAVIEGHQEKVTALAFSDDGSLLASGDVRGLMRVWSTDTWTLLAERSNEYVRALAFQGTDRLISSNGFRAIRLWSLPAFERGPDFAHEDNVHHLVMLPDGRRLLSGADDGTVRLWDLLSGEALAVMHHVGNTSDLTLAPDGRHVFFSGSSSQHNGNFLWALDPPTELEVFTSSDRGALGFSDDGRQLLVWSHREEGEVVLVRYLDLASRQYVDSLGVDRGGHPAYGRASMQLAMVDNNAGLLLGYNLKDQSMVRRTAVYLGLVDDVAFSPGGEWVAAASRSSIYIWDVASQKHLLTLRTGGESVDGVAFSDDCRDVYAAQTSGIFRRPLADLETALPILPAGGLDSFAFAPSVGKVAVGRWEGRGNSRTFWPSVVALATGREQRFEDHPDELGSLALSADGALLAASGNWREEPSIWLWQVADKVLLHRLPIYIGGYALAFSPNNDLLAASDWARRCQALAPRPHRPGRFLRNPASSF